MIVTTHQHSHALAMAAALGIAGLAPAALAQSIASDFHLLDLHYTPAQPSAGLDLRPGRYLLQLQSTSEGVHEGLLRGPRNETVAERIRFVASSGCAAGLPTDAVLSTAAAPARRGLNLLSLEISDSSGACTLEGRVPKMGLTTSQATGNQPDCEPPIILDPSGTQDPGPACGPPLPPHPGSIAAPRPDLKPSTTLRLAGHTYRWEQRVSLHASQAIVREAGRCFFDYSYAVHNSGRAPSTPSDASMLLDERLGLALDQQELPALGVGGTHRVQGMLGLPPGHWRLYVHVDASDTVGEYDGENNARVFRFEVAGSCDD